MELGGLRRKEVVGIRIRGNLVKKMEKQNKGRIAQKEGEMSKS